MRVGLYTIEVPASLGGGFVLRDDIALAAVKFGGRHSIELVTMYAPVAANAPRLKILPRLKAKVKRKLNHVLGLRSYARSFLPARLKSEVANRKLDLLWYQHIEPVQIDVPYILNIFDLQHRLQPCFPEVSANGQWELREKEWANSIRRAAIVTVGSQEAKEQLCHFYGVAPENVWVLQFPTPQRAIDIALGVAKAPELQDVRSKYGIRHDFLFYPAQFWPHKNHVNLLHALKLLREKSRDISLVLTGSDHGNRGHVEHVAAELGVADLVHFCGFVPYEDILTFYREARALAYVSFFGPENLPPLEAMALGCPVILADIPGVHSLHGDGPILVNPRSPRSIADGIAHILDNPQQIQDRIKAGREVAIRNDCQRYLEGFQDILDAFEPVRRCWP